MSIYNIILLVLFLNLSFLPYSNLANAQVSYLDETEEIQFSYDDSSLIQHKAKALGTPLRIYQYVRDNYEYKLYHGAQSAAINTFVNKTGNDVDLSSLLISMFRSQGIKSRYVLGVVKAPASQIASWLGVANAELAVSMMRDEGIQSVSFSANSEYIEFEHTWVEALIPYDNYRGSVAFESSNCDNPNAYCRWIELDPSYKEVKLNTPSLDIRDSVSFDYDRYHNAIKNEDPEYENKNPIEIYIDLLQKYLHANHAGIALKDIRYSTVIIPDPAEVLPASLPYTVVNRIGDYDSVQSHDLEMSTMTPHGKDWRKLVLVAGGDGNCFEVNSQPPFDCKCPKFSFVELSADSLAIRPIDVDEQLARRNDENYIRGLAFNFLLYFVIYYPQFVFDDYNNQPGPPEDRPDLYDFLNGDYWAGKIGDPEFNEMYDHFVSVFGHQSILQAGGKYVQTHKMGSELFVKFSTPHTMNSNSDVELKSIQFENFNGIASISIGGEYSGEYGYRRAIENLFQVAGEFPIQESTEFGPYIDYNNNRTFDTGVDKTLEEDTLAQNRLSCMFMGVVGKKYNMDYVRYGKELSSLLGTTSSPGVLISSVSTVGSTETYGDTPFLFVPGGMLIDAASSLSTVWDIHSHESVNLEALKLRYYSASSLEHEVLQELTGFDAISTVRALQHAVMQGGEIILAESKEDLPNAYEKLGFSTTPEEQGYEGRDWCSILQHEVRTTSSRYLRDFPIIYNSDQSNFEVNSIYDFCPIGFKRQSTPNELNLNMLRASISPGDAIELAPIIQYGNRTIAAIDEMMEAFILDYRDFYPIFNPDEILDLGEAYLLELNYANAVARADPNYTSTKTKGCYLRYPHIYFLPDGTVFIDRFLGRNVKDCMYKLIHFNYNFTIDYLIGLDEERKKLFNNDLLGVFNQEFAPPWSQNYSGDYVFYSGFANCLKYGFDEFGWISENQFPIWFAQGLRNTFYSVRINTDLGEIQSVESTHKHSFTFPSRPAVLGGNYFNAYIHIASNQDEALFSFYIDNNVMSGNGGYVEYSSDNFLYQSNPNSNIFDNSRFTIKVLVPEVNNDQLKTPSTLDPISTVTGNMYHDETDVVLKGRGLDIAFTRTYNSGRTSEDFSDLPISKGWTHSFNMRLKSNDFGETPDAVDASNSDNQVSSITYTDERGGDFNCVKRVDGTYAAPTGSFFSLSIKALTGSDNSIQFRNGVKYVFEPVDLSQVGAIAKLIRIEDPYGNKLVLSYNESGQLLNIADELSIAGRNGLTLDYHAEDGRLKSISDWTGRKWSFSYSNGLLDSVTKPDSTTMRYEYSSQSGKLTGIIYPENRSGQHAKASFTYYSNDKAYSYTNGLNQSEFLNFDLFRRKTKLHNPDGSLRTYTYDERGSLTKLEEPDGGILLFSNNPDGLRDEKVDALGYKTSYSYDISRILDSHEKSNSGGNVTLERDPLGDETHYDYGLHDQITRIRDRRSNEQIYEFYEHGSSAEGAVPGKLKAVVAKLESQTMPGEYELVTLEEYKYNTDSTLKEHTRFIDRGDQNRKRVTQYFYEKDGLNLERLTVTGYPSGTFYTIKLEYDDLGRMTSKTLERRTSAENTAILPLRTEYKYDSFGRITETKSPVGTKAEIVYDANGKIIQEKIHHKLQDGSYDIRVIKTYKYDAADRLIEEQDVFGKIKKYTYDTSGNRKSFTDENGNVTRYEYDAKNRRTAVIDANGNRTNVTFNLNGWVTMVTDANGNATSFEYDKVGRKTAEVTAEGHRTEYVYDPNGNLVKTINSDAIAKAQETLATDAVNAYGASIYNEYDEFNRVVRSVDAMDGETTYTYDLLGNMTSLTDAEGRTTTFEYDDLGRLVKSIDPLVESPEDKVETVDLYDEAGNVLLATDRKGQQTRYTYDILNRLVKTEFLATGHEESFTYDAYGDLVEVRNEYVTYAYGYDSMHRMTSKDDSRLGGKNLAWTYDDAGNVATKTDYQGEITHYQYDSTNRLVALRNPAYLQGSYHYDPAGRLLDRILSNGAATHYTYDRDGRLKTLTQKSAFDGIDTTTTYEHDPVGNITAMIAKDGSRTDFTYDDLFRLTDADYPGTDRDRGYTYDKVGNRTSETRNETVYVYDYFLDSNRLKSVSTDHVEVLSFSYDDNGNRSTMTAGAAQTDYLWDQKNRLYFVARGSEIWGSAFDPNDYRISEYSLMGASERFLEGEHLEAVYSYDGTPLASYLRGVVVDEVLSGLRYTGKPVPDSYTYHHDHLRSVGALTGHNGDLVQKTEYEPFGAITSETGTVDDLLKYTGRELDGTGLYYYRARYYDPEVGRFISEDPLGFDAGDVIFYVYVGNNPINHNDPSGQIAPVVLATYYLGGKALALGVSYLGIQAGTRSMGAAGLVEEPGKLGNRIWSGALEANRVQLQTALELSRLDPFVDAVSAVSGLDLTGVHINSHGEFTVPTMTSSEQSTLQLLVGGEFGFQALGALTGDSAFSKVGRNFGLIEAGSSIYSAAIGTNFSQTWDGLSSSSGGAADGGYLLYPSRPNTNMMRQVYSK